MSVFHLENNVVKISPEIIAIPEFKDIWDRDKSKEKGRAYKEIAYIYYITDYKSAYTAYPPAERELKIRNDFIKDDAWEPDNLVKLGIKKYEELQITPTLRLLLSAKIAAEKLSEFFRTQDPEHRSYTPNLEKLGKIIESLDKLEERVKKEETNQGRVRGGGTILARER